MMKSKYKFSRKRSSDKQSDDQSSSSIIRMYKNKRKFSKDFRNIKIDMKSPMIQKRTHLNILQAKLMSHIVKHKLSRDKFLYIVDKVGQTPERAKLVEVLYNSKNIMRSASRASGNLNVQDNSPQNDFLTLNVKEEEIDLSREVKNILSEYNQIQKRTVQRRTTSQFLNADLLNIRKFLSL